MPVIPEIEAPDVSELSREDPADAVRRILDSLGLDVQRYHTDVVYNRLASMVAHGWPMNPKQVFDLLVWALDRTTTESR